MIEVKVPRTRATIARERGATRDAISEIVGDDEADRLMDLGSELRECEHRPDGPPSATERAAVLAETAGGRAKLATLSWETV